MGVRCSLFGCEYDGTEIERDEEHRGDEVILTVREFKECVRCGETELVSENTGVTARVGDTRGPTSDESVDAGSEPSPDPGVEAAPEPTPAPGSADGSGSTGPDAFGPGAGSSDTETDSSPRSGGFDPGEDTASSAEADDPSSREADAPDEGGVVLPEDDEIPDPDENAVEGGPSLTDAIRDAEPDADEVEAGTAEGDERPDDDAVILEGGPDEGDDTGWSSDPAESEWDTDSGSDAGNDGAATADADEPSFDPTDAGDAATDGLASGDWPDHDDGVARDSWPDHDGEDGGWDATPDAGEDPSVDFSGLTPRKSVDAAGDSTSGNSPQGRDRGEATGDAGDGRTDPAGDRSPETAPGDVALADPDSEAEEGYDAAVEHGRDARTTRTDARDRLACPSCSFVTPPSNTPRRAGDLCPECGKDYLDGN